MDDRKLREARHDLSKWNNDLIAEKASGRSAYGMAARTAQAIENAEALLSGEVDPNNLDSRQVYELSKVLDRILSQGNPSIVRDRAPQSRHS